MKNFTISFLLALSIAFSFNSCTSDSPDEQSPAENSTGDYWPTTVGNSWSYSQDGTESIMKITGIDEMDGGKYYKFDKLVGFGDAAQASVFVWIKKNKGDYYFKIGEISTSFGDFKSKTTGYEFIMFKDYLDINQTWSGNYTHTTTYNIPSSPSVVTNVSYTGKILETGSSLTVNGIVFKDVIKFSFAQNASVPGVPVSEVVTNYWIAKNVGLIRIDNNGSLSELKTYSIK